AGLLEPGDCADLVHPAFHIGMPGLPVIGPGALLLEHRIGHEQSGRFHVGDEHCAPVLGRNVACKHHADLVGENLFARIVDYAAAVASPSKPRPMCALFASTASRMACSIFMSSVFG